MNEAAAAAMNWWGMLTDPGYLRNPYPELKRLREKSPVHFDPYSGVYFVLGYREFTLMARAPEMGRDTRLWKNSWNNPENRERDPLSYQLFSEFQRQMVNANPPEHRRMRGVYEKALKTGGLTEFLPMIEAECRQGVDALPVDTEFDFMASFAKLLPRLVSRNLFEIPTPIDEPVAKLKGARGQIRRNP